MELAFLYIAATVHGCLCNNRTGDVLLQQLLVVTETRLYTMETIVSAHSDIFLMLFIRCRYQGTYALSVLDIDKEKGRLVKHYRIVNKDNGGCFITSRNTFSSLDEMIKYYSGWYQFRLLKNRISVHEVGNCCR